ncbi:MAG: M3 family oligoendopeptidase [Nitrospirota bacterium]
MKRIDAPAWTLTDLYAGPEDPAITRDAQDALAQAEAFERRYRGRLAAGAVTPAELAEALGQIEAMTERLRKVATYASLLFSADMTDPRHGALFQASQEQATALRQRLTFFDLEWSALSSDAAAVHLAAPELDRYRHYLEVERALSPHRLSEPEELVLETKANTGVRAFQRLFDEVLAHARFEVVVGAKRERLTEQETLARLHAPSRAVRKAAARGLTKGLDGHAHILTSVFNVIAADQSSTDRLRKFPTPMAARNLANEIDQPAVDALLAAVERGYPVVRRYYRLKQRLLGVSRLYDYDRYAPLPASGRTIRWDQARRTVLDAFDAFSPDMAGIAARFFDGRWIDAAVRPGKRGGAFAHSAVPSAHPYVLLNYTGTARDVMTLAHELGHGVHQYLSRSQGCLQADTPLTMAETASVFGEMLVFRAIKEAERDPARALALVCGMIEDSCSTIFRQVVLTRFEQALHDARRRDGELSTERISGLWLAANRAMFGNSVTLTEDYGRWWSYIPHFIHSPFYCYAYAFGALLVFALYRRYVDEGKAFVPKYLALLSAGGSDAPERLLAKAGVDLGAPGFWDGGIEVLAEWVDQAEKLAVLIARKAAPNRRRGRKTPRR